MINGQKSVIAYAKLVPQESKSEISPILGLQNVEEISGYSFSDWKIKN